MGDNEETLAEKYLLMRRAALALAEHAGREKAVDTMRQQVTDIKAAAKAIRRTAKGLEKEAKRLEQGIDAMLAEPLPLSPFVVVDEPDGPDEEDEAEIKKLTATGHTEHCAKRQVWGDGACECPADGTGSPYHTMNPPPGGWESLEIEPKPDGVTRWIPRGERKHELGDRLRAFRSQNGIGLRAAATATNLGLVTYSDIERGRRELLREDGRAWLLAQMAKTVELEQAKAGEKP
jgi:hypothetical protein